MPTLTKTEALTVLRELGAQNIAAVEPCVATISKGIPIKKLLLVAEMSMGEGRALDPATFATTMGNAGLMDI